jgi:hydrogenase maturation protease
MDNRLFVGIGSPHGDDQVGWLVIDELAHQNVGECRRAQTPLQLLDWLDGVDELVLCDGVRSALRIGQVECWAWPTPAIREVCFQGTHDLSLPATLELAETLGRLPPKVCIWGVQIGDAAPNAAISSDIERRVPEIAQRIHEEYCDA